MKKCSDIIADLYNGKNFNECLSKMEPEHLREDLRQEVILVICELPEEKIIGMHERKELEFYTVRVILNMMRNSCNQFSKRFMDSTEELRENEEIKEASDSDIITQRASREKLEEKLLKVIRTTDKDDTKWYHKELLKIYLEKGNYRDVADDTLIPFTSVFQSITAYKKNLKEVFTNPIYTQQQAAKILNVTERTLRNWEQRKLIKPEIRRSGMRLVYTKKEIERVKDSMINLYNKKNKLFILNLKDEEINELPALNAKVIRLYKKMGNLKDVGESIGLRPDACQLNVRNTIQILEERNKIKEVVNNQKLLDQPSLNHLNLMNTLEYINQQNAS